MKKRKNLLLYIFSITFCCLISLFVYSNKVNAFSYVCVDSVKELNGEDSFDCDSTTDYSKAYAKIISMDDSDIVEVDVNGDIVKKVTIPNSFSYTPEGAESLDLIVHVIGDSENPLITYDGSYVLNEVVLPNNIKRLASYSLSGFASIEKLVIPVSMEDIESNIFADTAKIQNIYFNAYRYSNGLDDIIRINTQAFAPGVVNNIICDNIEVYMYYKEMLEPQGLKQLSYNSLLTKIVYNFYPYEGSSELIDSREYYYNENVLIKEGELEEGISVEGLTFVLWQVKNSTKYCDLNVGQHFCADVRNRVTVYNVYPKFILNPVNNIKVTYSDNNVTDQDLVDNKLSFTYDGFTRVLDISYDQHPIATQTVVWYKDGVVIDPSVYRVYDSGKYRYEIISQYNYHGELEPLVQYGVVDIEVKQKNLDVYIQRLEQIYGVGLKQGDCSYEVEGLISVHSYVVATCQYNSEELTDTPIKLNAGEYPNKLSLEIKAIQQDEYSGNEKDNYKIVYHSDLYVVKRKEIKVSYLPNVNVYYGDEILIRNIHSDQDTHESIEIEYTKAPGSSVGVYDIISARSMNPNYSAELDDAVTHGKVIIAPKGVNVKPSLNGDIYDGKAKRLTLTYEDVISKVQMNFDYILYKDGVEVEKIVNAGDYTAKIVSFDNDNYYIINHEDLEANPYIYELNIKKADPVIVKSGSGYQTVTYTGDKMQPHAIVNNNEQKPIYTCLDGDVEDPNGCIEAGMYRVRVSVEESENYKAVTAGEIWLTIAKRPVSLNPKKYTFYYNDPLIARETIVVENPNGEKVTIDVVYTIEAKQGDLPGNYHIVGATAKIPSTNNDNMNFSLSVGYVEGSNKVEIKKRPVNIVYFDYTDLVYNGKVQQIGVRAVDALNDSIIRDLNLVPECDEGEIKNAGKYHLRSHLDDPRYVVQNSNLLEFEIAKATYDLSNVKFIDKKVVLNFKEHYLTISGILPQGVEVNYTIDGKEGNSTSKAFKHTVVANFVGNVNYHPIDPMEATIYVDTTWVFMTILGAIMVAGIIWGIVIMYIRYRRAHPKKIKLKIRNVVKEDLASKRAATSVKEVLGEALQEEHSIEVNDENDDDLVDNINNTTNFIDRIYAASSELKYYYSEVKNELLSYEGVAHTVDRKYEVFYHGPRQIAKLSICNGILRLYVNLDPDKYDKNQYNHRDMSKFDCHARTPLRLDVDTTESLRHAKVFIRILRKRENLKSVTGFVRIDYEKFYTLKENFFPKMFKNVFGGKKNTTTKK